MAKRGQSPIACIAPGYKYKLRSRKPWRTASDERWDTVVAGRTCGEYMGARNIDGSRVEVVRTKRGRFYAALPMHVTRK